MIEKDKQSLMEDLMIDCVEFVVHNTSEVEMSGCYELLGSNIGYMIKMGKAIANSSFFISRLNEEDWWNTFVTSEKLKNL